MQVPTGEMSQWIYSLIFTSLQLWGTLHSSSFATPSPAHSPPVLNIHSRSENSVVFICKVTQGNPGVLFMLYRFREMVDYHELQSGAEEVQFTVRINEENTDKLFCCLYKDHQGHYSAFSPYLRLKPHTDPSPTLSLPPFPRPFLSVVPSTGEVKRGGTLSFSCSLPSPTPEQQSSGSSLANKPVSFFLLRKTEQTEAAWVEQLPRASLMSSPDTQTGVFTVGPVERGDDGQFSCIYQISNKEQLVNSTVSNIIQVTIRDMLPLPTLALDQRADVQHLLCTGSAAYPGAVFFLYLAESEHPITTIRAKTSHHQVTFQIPVQETPVASYQCQYSFMLERKWSQSERSKSLSITTGLHPPTTDVQHLDWPLLVGSLSAVLLFLCSVVLVVVLTHRKVKSSAEMEKKRQEAKFWTQIHAKDHPVDLTLRCSSFNSQEWSNGETEMASRFPTWNSHSTFTTVNS
ncbi:uncharacterized protein LOC103384157 isoform X1 [Cynoglossus semilaevis]|uniref:uncharacterized protein LOC103384157 isoform X1 n=1 Tax=Cynoglossus semilaevis TaxID=244447 RepID=UPI0007DC906B|nr:uncharacterized protein LOC103384157 isoform X1 [Cynoglossus semilaevis]